MYMKMKSNIDLQTVKALGYALSRIKEVKSLL